MKTIRIALVQVNPIVGDLTGNTYKITESIQKLTDLGVEIAVFPELAVCGYPPEDLLLKPYFIKDAKAGINKIKNYCKNITVVAGFPDFKSGNLYNSAAIIRDKEIIYTYHKMHLPNYGVFDEKRYFSPDKECAVIHEDGINWSVNICEDIWVSPGPILHQAGFGMAQLIINISASPYHRGKLFEREDILKEKAKRYKTTIAYCNLVGGQDELVFDGGSFIIDPKGRIIARAKQFEEDTLIADLEIKPSGKRPLKNPFIKHITKKRLSILGKPKIQTGNITPLPPLEEVYKALVLGTRDYVHKNGFKKVILGLSGGIDSALTIAIAVDALGRENVVALSMPSQFTSKGTKNDAKILAGNLGIEFNEIPIIDIFSKYIEILSPYFSGRGWDAAEENLQARIRGSILMAFSNKFGYMVLTTGNKSETSVGYCTLYGDMAGGFAVIKDVPKQLVYELSKYRNKKDKLIPETIFTRPPTAELKENQKDSDSLPAYPVLDPIIEAYVEQDKSLKEIVKRGVKEDIARRVLNLIDKNEYKRRQAPPGVKITPKAFGKDRRMPITCRIP